MIFIVTTSVIINNAVKYSFIQLRRTLSTEQSVMRQNIYGK